MFLRDYHRENLLSGIGEGHTVEDTPKTFAQEQEDLKRTVVKEMHAAADDAENDAASSCEDGENNNGGFLVPKTKPVPSGVDKKTFQLDIEAADKDPETFLSNFLTSRAWIPTETANLQPFESDDEDEDNKAEAF